MRTGRYLQSVRAALAEGVRTQLDLALSGDALAARRLMIVVPRRLRGHIANLAYHLRTRNPAYREIVKGVWADDSRHLLTAHWPQPTVRRMLARADFPRPELAGPVSIYRAVVKGSAKRAAAGLCWRLSREMVAAEALRANPAGARILKSSIDPGDIIYSGGRRGAQEVVPRHPVEKFLVEPVSAPALPSTDVTSTLGAGRLGGARAARGRTRRSG